MLLFAWVTTACHAQPEVPPPAPQQQQIEDLERIVDALERVHPEIVAEVVHEETHVQCEAALKDIAEHVPMRMVSCLTAEKEHGVDVLQPIAVLDALKQRHPEIMAVQADPYWTALFNLAQPEFVKQSAVAEAALMDTQSMESLPVHGP